MKIFTVLSGVLAAGTICALGAFSVHAQTIYKAEINGTTTYSNSPMNGAVKISPPPLSVMPAVHVNTAAQTGQSKQTSSPEATTSQKARESKRDDVLNEELTREKSALEVAEQDLTAQESIRLGGEKNYQKVIERLAPYKENVELHKKNIEALLREKNAKR